MDQKSILTTFCINRTELDSYEKVTKLNWISPLTSNKLPVMLFEQRSDKNYDIFNN